MDGNCDSPNARAVPNPIPPLSSFQKRLVNLGRWSGQADVALRIQRSDDVCSDLFHSLFEALRFLSLTGHDPDPPSAADVAPAAIRQVYCCTLLDLRRVSS
jgi:hypothetical protein